MGFDWRKVPTIREGFALTGFTPAEVEVELGDKFRFKPHFGWLGHIEA
jgi:hypothetical protein